VLGFVGKEDDGDKIFFLEAVTCRTPKSTFEMTFFANRFKMHSNTYDFNVPYTSVKRLFKVPSGVGSKPGHYLTLLLDPPLRKGQTHYSYVVLFFESDEGDEDDARLNLPDGFETTYKNHPEKLKDKVKKHMKGLMVDIVGDILRFFATTKDSECKILTAKKFESSANRDHSGKQLPAIKCSIGANVGQLYMLDQAFLFLEKDPKSFMYEDVQKITFDRNQSQQKGIKSSSFDFKIKLTNGKSQDFNQIPKVELKNLETWFTSQSAQKFNNQKMVITNFKDEDDDDDDEPGGGSDDDAGIKNRIRAEAGEDDDSDEEDDDFQGGAGSESSSEEGSDDDESGSGGGSASDDDKPKKKSKKEKKAKKDKKPKKDIKKKEKKEKKDPNEPKRAKSSYMLFCDEYRAKIRVQIFSFFPPPFKKNTLSLSLSLSQRGKALRDPEQSL